MLINQTVKFKIDILRPIKAIMCRENSCITVLYAALTAKCHWRLGRQICFVSALRLSFVIHMKDQ